MGFVLNMASKHIGSKVQHLDTLDWPVSQRNQASNRRNHY